ncbi:cytochrome c [Prosthecomicrobium sp. N25]|uniref:cytochrome c n=1 Tax=Prosthecomicrobium sp. N25 TaxID=3129254 RepID=UPI003077B01B
MLGTDRGGRRGRIAVVALVALVTAVAPGASAEAPLTPERRDDIVQARQLLMDAVEERVTALDGLAAGGTGPLKDLTERAYLISTLIAAFPHLFPDGTRPDQIGPDGTATNALPSVWARYDAFYDLARTASAAALEASQAKDQAGVAKGARALRQACDGCHAGFMGSTGQPSVPQK